MDGSGTETQWKLETVQQQHVVHGQGWHLTRLNGDGPINATKDSGSMFKLWLHRNLSFSPRVWGSSADPCQFGLFHLAVLPLPSRRLLLRSRARVILIQDARSQYFRSEQDLPSIGTGDLRFPFPWIVNLASLPAQQASRCSARRSEKDCQSENREPRVSVYRCLFPSPSKPFRPCQFGRFHPSDDRHCEAPAKSCRQPSPGTPPAWCPRS